MPLFTRRASTACTVCQARKVRCDATALGQPCTRCRQDDTECVMRMKRPLRLGSRVLPPGSSTYPLPSRKQSNQGPDTTRAVNREPPQQTVVNREEQSEDVPGTARQSHVSFSSYPFLELDGPGTYEKETTAFLNMKGCLSIPRNSLLEEFMKQYFLHIQPCTPIIDESIFWELFRQANCDDSTRKIPLLLFQAMIFASSPYISVATARDCGFENKRDAWNAFHQRAKTLFYAQDEGDSLSRAQAALLLSFHTSPGQPQEATLWLTTSIHSAKVASFKTGETVLTGRSANKLVLDRLWWSILLRDRSLSLGLRRRPQTSPVELRMMGDLPDERSFTDEINGSHVYDPYTKRALFTVFREQCRLAVLLTEMVSLVFETNMFSFSSLPYESFQATLVALNCIRASIQSWQASTPLSQLKNTDTHAAVVHFTNMTVMYYEAAQMELAHYEALLIQKHQADVGVDFVPQLSHTGSILYEATTRLITILDYFSQKGNFEDMPLTIVGYTAMPLILSAINFKLSGNHEEMDARRQPVESLSKLMTHSRRVYDVTDLISTRTDDMLQLAYLVSGQVFLQNTPRGSDPRSIQSLSQNPSHYMQCNVSNPRRGRAQNWLDAFLRHTRAYLLISMTVDYYMSVGELPQTNALPELVFLMPPFGKIQLPWALQLESPERTRYNEHTKHNEQEEQLPQSTDRNEPSPTIQGAEDTRLAHAIFGYVTSLETGENRGPSCPTNNSHINLDYLDLEPLLENAG